MSLLGSMTTAISGLASQARALGHISDNIANSQTLGYKRVDTSFTSWLTRSTSRVHLPGSVEARPDYTNTVQGTIEQVENPLAMAIAGQGFFSVSQARGSVNGQVTFDERQFFTRAGDFSLDEDGYLVNSAGYYLEGWEMDQAGNPDRTQLDPIQISQLVYNPVATSRIDLAANLPASVENGETVGTQVNVYDSLGTVRSVVLNWTKNGENDWTLSLTVPEDQNNTDRGSVDVRFGTTAVPATASGTIGQFLNVAPTDPDSISANIAAVPDDPAQITFTADFGQGAQTITLDLGAIGQARGLTQYSGQEYTLRNLAQDGVPLGSYSGVSLRENGDLAVNYDNGQTRIVARVPIVAFNDPDKLQRLDGQAFMRTLESGEARVTDAASNGVGKIVTSSVEKANVDIASEFAKLILAQRAYSSGTRVVTASDEMLQDTINMKR